MLNSFNKIVFELDTYTLYNNDHASDTDPGLKYISLTGKNSFKRIYEDFISIFCKNCIIQYGNDQTYPMSDYKKAEY